MGVSAYRKWPGTESRVCTSGITFQETVPNGLLGGTRRVQSPIRARSFDMVYGFDLAGWGTVHLPGAAEAEVGPFEIGIV